MTSRTKRKTAARSILCAAVFFAFTAPPAGAGDFARALQAYDAGDYVTAAAIWQTLAEEGDSEAKLALGDLLLRGPGLPRDPERGVALIRSAAQQGHAVAQLNLGEILEEGRYQSRDMAAAWAWYSLASDQGRVWAAEQAARLAASFDSGQEAHAREILAGLKSDFPALH